MRLMNDSKFVDWIFLCPKHLICDSYARGVLLKSSPTSSKFPSAFSPTQHSHLIL
jgi:hypothetical protein